MNITLAGPGWNGPLTRTYSRDDTSGLPSVERLRAELAELVGKCEEDWYVAPCSMDANSRSWWVAN